MTVRTLTGDVFDRLADLADESVHCVVTSPPYWGLRDYGTARWDGGDDECEHAGRPTQTGGTKSFQPTHEGSLTGTKGDCIKCGAHRVDQGIGLEPTFDEHLEIMVRVFREVRRVLRKDGTLWLNYGDAYAGSANGRSAADTKAVGKDDRTFRDKPFSTVGGVHKAKDLMMMPARVALALQADGWWLRSEIVWHKPNPMPESAKDRPTSAHEKIYLLTKSARYFYDAEAVRTPSVHPGDDRKARAEFEHKTAPTDQRNGMRPYKMPDGWDTGPGAHGKVHRKGREKGKDKQRGHSRRHDGFNDRWDGMTPEQQQTMGANLRNVWPVATQPFPGAHFAVMPTAIVEPCIKAGCPASGVVLDPFGGSGTVGLVADRLGRDAILIELNPEYSEMARRRIADDAGMFAEVA